MALRCTPGAHWVGVGNGGMGRWLADQREPASTQSLCYAVLGPVGPRGPPVSSSFLVVQEKAEPPLISPERMG